MNVAPDARKLPLRLERLSQRKTLRAIAEVLVVVVCTVVFVFTAVGICMAVLGPNAAGSRDFVEYWASGQQLLHRANPYDANAILRIERSLRGFPSDIPAMVMGNAPPALLLVLPLGFLGARSGEILWSLVLLACLVASVRMVRKIHGAPKNQLHYLGYSFGPALACAAAGQASLFVLLGLALFLRFHRSRPFLAGASLWLCALKPQIFLPFGLVLLAWIIASRRYRVLIGVASALGFSTAVAFVLDPLAWTQYRQMMSVLRYDRIPIPCLSMVLRRSISPNTMWLQYLPAFLGCVWALAYFRRHRTDWDWMAHGSPLMLVSVLVAPYTWLVDQSVLIPALLHGLYLTRSRTLVALLALASAAIEIAPLRGMELLHSSFYLWTAPGWLAWYLYATRASNSVNAFDPRGVDPELTMATNGQLCPMPGLPGSGATEV